MSAAGLARLSRGEAGRLARSFQGLVTDHEIPRFVRISSEDFRDSPLGTGSGPSRFGPRVRADGRPPPFEVMYLAQDLATALYETVIRDRFDLLQQRMLTPSDYSNRVAFNVSTKPSQVVSLIDLTSGRATAYGVPTDVTRYSRHDDGQYFAEFVYANMSSVDGVLYRSRFTERHCIAVFDRGVNRLDEDARYALEHWLVDSALAPWQVTVS